MTTGEIEVNLRNKNQLTLPEAVVRRLGLQPGDRLMVEIDDEHPDEVKLRPLRLGVTGPYQHLMDFLTRFPNLHALQVDLVVAQEAASVRAAHRLSAPDALIVATGIVGQVHHRVTNDADWVRKLQQLAGRINVCRLANHL